MKQCKRCGAQLADNAEMCTRCGGIEFNGGEVSPRPQMRPQNTQGAPVRPQGAPMRPQGAPNQFGQTARPQGQMGMNQRPNQQMPNQQMPNQQMPNQQMPNQFGQPARPQGMQGQNNQFGQNNMQGGMNNPYGLNQQTVQGTDAFGNKVNFDPNAVAQEPKKGLFGKGNKEPKVPKQPKNKGNKNNQDMNNFGDMGFGAQPQDNKSFGDSGLGNTGMQNTPNMQATPGVFGVITVKKWLILWLQMCIPVWNIIMIIKTLTNQHEDPSIKNFIKAYLIMLGIGLVLGILSSVLLSTALVGILS